MVRSLKKELDEALEATAPIEVDLPALEPEVDAESEPPKKSKVITEIADLPGVGPTTADKLIAAGFRDLMSIATAVSADLVEAAGVGSAVAKKIIQTARDALNLGSFISGRELLEKHKNIVRIDSGSIALNNLIGGGFETGSITEAFGIGGSGKCLSKDTKVLINNELTEIQDVWKSATMVKSLNNNEEMGSINLDVLSLDETAASLVAAKASHIFRMKVPYILRLKTEAGRILELSETHKLPTFHGDFDWTAAKNLIPGEYIRIPFYYGIYSEQDSITADDAYFVGIFVAEGSSNPMAINTGDLKLKDWTCKYIKERWGYEPTTSFRKNCYRILIRKNTIDALLSKFIKRKSAHKHIPQYIKDGSREIKIQFFSGYYESDGYIKDHSVTTKSKTLASDLCYLLNSLNTNYSLRYDNVPNYGLYYKINILGEFKFDLKFKSKSIISKQVGTFGIPKIVYKELIQFYRGLRKRDKFSVKRDKRIKRLREYINGTCKRMGNPFFLRMLGWFAERDIELAKRMEPCSRYIWDKIISVEKIEYNDYIYDLVVPGYQNFVGGELPTLFHNTQIAHMLCLNLAKLSNNAEAVYIDCENCFKAARIEEMALARGMDPQEALARIKIAKAFSFDHQILLAEKVQDLINEGHNIKLVIIDSIIAHARSELTGRANLAERQHKLGRHLATLSKLADSYNICVFITNQVMSNPGQLFGDPIVPVGGNILAHASANRLYLRRGKKGTRVAKLVDSIYLPDGECVYQVTAKGIEDI